MKAIYAIVSIAVLFCACEQKEESGWDYNNPSYSGFQKVPYEGDNGPGLILIPEDTVVYQDVDSVAPLRMQIDENGDTIYRRRVVRNSWKNIDYYLNNGTRTYDSVKPKQVSIEAFYMDSNETGG